MIFFFSSITQLHSGQLPSKKGSGRLLPWSRLCEPVPDALLPRPAETWPIPNTELPDVFAWPETQYEPMLWERAADDAGLLLL